MVFDPREVTPAWMTAVLRRADPGAPEVVAIEREPIGTGQVGRCVRFHCRFAGDAGHRPSTVVGKFPSEDPRSLQAAKDNRNDLLEVGFYRELPSTVAVRTPLRSTSNGSTASSAFRCRAGVVGAVRSSRSASPGAAGPGPSLLSITWAAAAAAARSALPDAPLTPTPVVPLAAVQ